MIRYVVFDYGKTLIQYDEFSIARHYVDTDEEAKELAAVFFDRFYCDRLDAGMLAEEERIKHAKTRLPVKYHSILTDMSFTWYRHLPAIQGMSELVNDLHGRGIAMYLLSNINAEFGNHIKDEPILRHFSGGVLSGLVQMVKPGHDIYRCLLEKYNLDPQFGLFVDDREENVKAACEVGLQGYLFDGNATCLASYINAHRK